MRTGYWVALLLLVLLLVGLALVDWTAPVHALPPRPTITPGRDAGPLLPAPAAPVPHHDVSWAGRRLRPIV
jgi:hypothetical protein